MADEREPEEPRTRWLTPSGEPLDRPAAGAPSAPEPRWAPPSRGDAEGADDLTEPIPYRPGPPPRTPTPNPKATASLVLAIGGLFLCPAVLSAAALVLGYQARDEIEEGNFSNPGQAKVGIVVGWVGFVSGAILLLLMLFGVVSPDDLNRAVGR